MMSPRLVFGDRSARRESELIDEEVIADEQRVFHGTGGDHEGLHQSGGAEQEKDDGNRPLRDKSALRFRLSLGRRLGLRGRRGYGL
jgi:hypothetical protein